MQHKMVKLADKMRPRLTDIKLSPPKVWQPLPQQPSCQRCPADNSLVPQPGWAQGNFGHTLHILAHNIRISFWAGITYSFVDRFFLRQEIYFLLTIDLCNFLSTFFFVKKLMNSIVNRFIHSFVNELCILIMKIN